MQRCSTSLTGNFVAAAIDSKDINREAPFLGRENAAWIKAIKQIFCRRKLMDALRIGWMFSLHIDKGHKQLTSASKLLARESNLPISPALKAEIRLLIHSHSDPARVCRIGCSSY